MSQTQPGGFVPKSQLDWLGVVSLWVGALVMAFKASDAPLVSGAPTWLAANWWNYVPLVLVTFYLGVALYRHFHPLPSPIPFSIESLPKAPAETPAVVPVREPAPVAAPVLEDQERKERRERQRVIQSLDHAHRVAGMAMADATSSGRERVAERELPGMRAAMLSAHKVFGMPLPPESRTALMDLELQRRMIEKALPFLQEGHPEEACREAQAFLDRLTNKEGGGQA